MKISAAADYSADQIAETWIAEQGGTLVGFTDLDGTVYIDMMFVDPAVARTGVATALLSQVRELAQTRGLTELTVNASATARPFFEQHSFTVRVAQEVERNGVILSNSRMTGPVAPTVDAS